MRPVVGAVASMEPFHIIHGRGRIAAPTLLTALAPLVWGTTYAVSTEMLPPGHPLFAGGLIAYTLFFSGIGKLPVTSVAPLSLLSPMMAATVGVAVLGESLTPIQLPGMGIALASVVAAQLSPPSRRPPGRGTGRDRTRSTRPRSSAVTGAHHESSGRLCSGPDRGGEPSRVSTFRVICSTCRSRPASPCAQSVDPEVTTVAPASFVYAPSTAWP
jgi:hypothetical protein